MTDWALHRYNTESPDLRDHDAERAWCEHVYKVNLAGYWEVKAQEARLPSWGISHGEGMNPLSIFQVLQVLLILNFDVDYSF